MVWSVFLNFTYSVCMYLFVVLVIISQITDDLWACFNVTVCLSYIFWCMKCLFKSFAHILFGIFVFLLLSFGSSLYTNALLDMLIAKIFAHLWLVFSFSEQCPSKSRMLNFEKVFISFLLWIGISVIAKKSISNSITKISSYTFP